MFVASDEKGELTFIQNLEQLGIVGTKAAAEKLDMSHQNLKYHLYHGHIRADLKVGHSLLFTRATLEDFDRRWPKQGKNGLRKKAPEVFDVEPIEW